MKFSVTLASPKGAFRNEDRVESTEFVDAPSADVAYARALAKWPEHDVRRVTATARWTLESGTALGEVATTGSAPHFRPAAR
jgi:hypothetical protein